MIVSNAFSFKHLYIRATFSLVERLIESDNTSRINVSRYKTIGVLYLKNCIWISRSLFGLPIWDKNRRLSKWEAYLDLLLKANFHTSRVDIRGSAAGPTGVRGVRQAQASGV
jgi:hypothetical protein